MLINMNHLCNTLMNGGNNYLVNQKVKTSKVSILQVPTTTDLHSLGQYVQEGRRFLFETVKVNHPKYDITIEKIVMI